MGKLRWRQKLARAAGGLGKNDRARVATTGRVQLDVRNLSVVAGDGTKRVNDVSFEVRSGEIVGIAGVEGNGQTELMLSLIHI